MKVSTEGAINLVAGNLLKHCESESDYFFSADYSNPEKIEKYFGEPFKENDQDFKNDQNKFSPKNGKVQSDKTGRI